MPAGYEAVEARHSITSSAFASIEGGTARPIAFAIFSVYTSYKDLGIQAVSVTHILRALVISGAISGILAIFGPTEARIGPGFDCMKAKQPLAQLICTSDTLSEIDLRLNQVYGKYRNALDTASKRRLDAEEVQFLNRVVKLCRIPNDADIALQESSEITDAAVERSACIEQTYRSRTDELTQRAQNAGVAITTQQSAAPPTPTKVGRTDTPAASTTIVVETVQLEHQHGVYMVPVEHQHGVYMVPVRINDAITIPFVLDSGAADISVPEDVFKTLIRTGTVMESDFLAPATYVNADGVAHSRQRFMLHQLRVGDQVVKDVIASVASDKADPLLGQNFLKKLPAWTMDNTRHTLVLGSNTPPQTAAVTGQSPQPQRGPPVATISPPATPEPRLTVAEIMKRANAARYGFEGSQDYAEAMRWFRKAADQGIAEAQNTIGEMYLKGQGVPQDYAQAMRWYRKATDQGLAEARNNIGYLYSRGLGVPQDCAAATKWTGRVVTVWCDLPHVGDCVNTTIKQVGTRLVGSGGSPVRGSGSAIEFTDGGYQVSYSTVPEIE